MFVTNSYKFFVIFISFVFAQAVHAASLPNFTELVEQVGPAVVNISTTQKVKPHAGLPPGMEMPDLPENSPWGELFKKFFGDKGAPSEDFNTQSLGSGFIIDSSGYVITNNHVIRNAEEIIVRLTDRREFKAEVIGSDPRSDVALLKVDATGLPTVKMADADNLKVGEWVMAIGSPFGFDHSVSVGVVSAIGRNLPSENYVPFIQTDVAINPGNSGGPLFNLDGEVVGINSQIYSRTGGFMGLSFAIPMKVANEVVEQLKDKGKVTRGWLGILIQDVNRELAESFGMKQPKGAVVLRILEDSPASKAGFKVGDVVVDFDGVSINRSSDLPIAVGSTRTGSKVKVKVIREGKSKTLKVVIEELPSEEELADSKPDKSSKLNRIGATVSDLTEAQRGTLDIQTGGVYVQKIGKGPARESGIKSGDVILKLNGVDIKNAKQFRSIVKKLPTGKSLPILIQRRASPIFLVIKINEE
ncbi:HtrA protease/chaperone protein [hydrothermal vent metagenome]|uniref:Probable periplasmic serine endoprotease DegP-like n=1 Tax=hydrothermal vent metagenome TaxID=652676 RepID=A0A3B1ANT8_9ZZZZ